MLDKFGSRYFLSIIGPLRLGPPLIIQGGMLEHLQSRRHGPDFILPSDFGNGHSFVAFRQAMHHLSNSHNRTGNFLI